MIITHVELLIKLVLLLKMGQEALKSFRSYCDFGDLLKHYNFECQYKIRVKFLKK